MENLEKKPLLFNSPLEIALRLLFVFNRTSKALDLQRLIYYNYLLVHSSDVPKGPKSIHADLPRRSSEMLVNRTVVKRGLTLLLLKDLISVQYDANGILYAKGVNTEHFVNFLNSSYSEELINRADWLCSKFDSLSDDDLSNFMKSNIGKWGSEFSMIYNDVSNNDF